MAFVALGKQKEEKTVTINIGVDLDNVIAETSLYVAQLVAERHIPGFTVDHHTSWHLTDCTGLTHEQQESLYDDLHANLDKLIPVPGAQAALDKLTRDGHYIHILTHRPYAAGVATASWLHDNLIVHHKLTICEDKTTLIEGIDVLIDDSPDVACRAANNGTLVYLYNRPWNQNIPFHSNILRVNNWSDIRQRLKVDFPLKTSKTPPPIPEEDILAEAYRLTSGDRQRAYGHPYDDFSRTGRLWAALLDLEEPIPPHKVGMMMVCLKLSRLCHTPSSRDSILDCAGYARCTWLCVEQDVRDRGITSH